LRDEGDALRLRSALAGRPQVVVIGAGFLGMEVAAVARGRGLDVSVVDPLPTPMGRQFGAHMGTWIAELHRAHGVRLFTGVGVGALRGSGGRVTGVLLGDDRLLPADCVLVAIGAAPELGWLRGTGVPLGDGIECDAYCQAGPALYAAGDVASWPSPRYGRRLRLEHRMNATEQGTAAALNLLHGNVRAFDPVPYFWTDQFDVKVQAHGIFPAGAEPVIAEGRPGDGKFVAVYEEGGRTVGVLGWNSPREVRRYRQQFTDAVTPGGAT
jgi:NADPH-dependent 2,4-dienoyl-CoA reductase/sulfur reductase-like enzyme